MTTLAAASASSSAQPGALAFLVVFGMAIVLVFLFRSMSKHLRKVNAAAREQEAAREQAGDPVTDAAAYAAGSATKDPPRAGDLPTDS